MCQNDTACHYSSAGFLFANNETNWESISLLKHILQRNQASFCFPVWPLSPTLLIIYPKISRICAKCNDYSCCRSCSCIDIILSLLTGLFYYAGHGYEHAGRNYLVAVDAPQPYRPENCVCVQRIVLSMQKKHTALSVILLDTCRKW